MSDPTPPGEPDPRPGWGVPPEQPPAGPYGPPVGPPGPYAPYPQQGVPYPQQGVPYPGPGDSGGPGWYPSGPVTNQKAQWALAVGLVSVVGACCSGILGLVGIVAVVLGVQARREIAASGGRESGGGLAVTGIVTGILGVLIALGLALLFLLLVGVTEGIVATR